MIPFSPPHIDQKIIDEVIDTLKSGWITTGPKTYRFEQELARYCGNSHTVCVSSATAGLELVLRWFGVGPGDEVIVPAYTYCATANVVLHCGAKPVMVDVNPGDFNLSVEAVRKALTRKTKVIIPVDVGGWPCDYDELYRLVQEHRDFVPSSPVQEKLGRILILADAAHSFGARDKGKKAGTLADISVFSFHAVKNLTTAEGGAIAFNLPPAFDAEELYHYFHVFSLHGQTKDALAKTNGDWRYDVIEAGYKANMTDLQASIGLVELSRYESDILPRRRQIVHAYIEALQSFPWAEIPPVETATRQSSFHLFLLRIKNITEPMRDELIRSMREKGVAVNVHFQPLPLLSAYSRLGYRIDDYPVAYHHYEREISLPVYYTLTDEQVHTVCDALIASVKELLPA